jgi:hypothetical protein
MMEKCASCGHAPALHSPECTWADRTMTKLDECDCGSYKWNPNIRYEHELFDMELSAK